MPVVSPHIYYVGSIAYDLRKVLTWSIAASGAAYVQFISAGQTPVVVQFINGAAFEAAMQASLNA